MTDWHAEGLKTIEELRDLIHKHVENKTRPTEEGMFALEMLLNSIIKSVRCTPNLTKHQLIDEIVKRDGVEHATCPDEEKWGVVFADGCNHYEVMEGVGPSVILVVKQ